MRVHRDTYSILGDIKQQNIVNEWTTHLRGVDGFHTAIFHPPERRDIRIAIEAVIPEYFRRHYIDAGGSCRARQVAPRSKLILLMLRDACELALEDRSRLVIHTKTIQELNQSIRWMGRHYPAFRRVALERDYVNVRWMTVRQGGVS